MITQRWSQPASPPRPDPVIEPHRVRNRRVIRSGPNGFPVFVHQAQEPGGLSGGPYPHNLPPALLLPALGQRGRPYLRLRPGGPGQLREAARVDGDQPGTDRAVERRAQRGVDPVQRRRAHRAPEHGLVADDRAEHCLHVTRGEGSERDAAQVRDQVAAHVRRVAPGSGRAQRHPGLQPPPEPLPGRQLRLGAGCRGRERLTCRCRRRLGGEPAAPDPPPLPGCGRQVGAEVPRPVLQVAQARAARPEQPSRALVPAPAAAVHRLVIHGPSLEVGDPGPAAPPCARETET
jgi:hypothetical protein